MGVLLKGNSGSASWPSLLGEFSLGLALALVCPKACDGPADHVASPPPAGAPLKEDLTSFTPVRESLTEQAPASESVGCDGQPEVRTVAFERPYQPRIFFGGGVPDPAGLQRFWSYAGGNEGNIVVIGWGSQIPDEYYSKLHDSLHSAVAALAESSGEDPQSFKVTIERMPDLDKLIHDTSPAFELLKKATAVFFLGGDQVRLMRALTQTGIDEVIRHLIESDAIVGAGTSAGTAIGSPTMIGGNGTAPDEEARSFIQISHTRVNEDGQSEDRPFFVGRGLGIVPSDVVIEQHLKRKGRVERLMRAVETIPHITWGVGIDDSMALVWNGEGKITALGEGRVLIVRKNDDGSVEEVVSLTDGESFDLGAGDLADVGFSEDSQKIVTSS